MQVGFENNYEETLIKPVSKLEGVYKETEELIAIMAKSIETANKNKLSKIKDTRH